MSTAANDRLAAVGERKIQWVRRNMPVLRGLERQFAVERPFADMAVAVSVHLEAKTAYLALVLQAGGAKVAVTGSNPLSTKDDIVAALHARGLAVFARHGANPQRFKQDQIDALAVAPHIVIDDGGDLVHHLHEDARSAATRVIGACEETTAGVVRNRARAAAGRLAFPVLAVNDAKMKHLFDNRYGTGQSVLEALMRSTNLNVAGAVFVVVGYGWCGRGIAACARGLGARVVVCEVDEVAAIEAHMDGFAVAPLKEAVSGARYLVTATGIRGTVGAEVFDAIADGAVLANAGHFADEIDLDALRRIASEAIPAREHVETFVLPNGRSLSVVADGKIVNIAAGDGHPAEIMDTSFAVQALSARFLAMGGIPDRSGRVLSVPESLDRQVAALRLESLGMRIDTASDAQRAYAAGYER